MVLYLVEQAEHLISLHALHYIWVRTDVPMEKVYRCTQQLLLQGAEPLCWLTIASDRGGAQTTAAQPTISIT
jgi:hypothetical protein